MLNFINGLRELQNSSDLVHDTLNFALEGRARFLKAIGLHHPTYHEFVFSCANGNSDEVENAIECLTPKVIASNENGALCQAAQYGHLAVVRRLLSVDSVRAEAIRVLNLNFGADKNVDQQINILINRLADNNPKLMKSLRNNEAQTLCFAYSSLGRHGQPNALLRKTPIDYLRLMAKMVQDSPASAKQKL